MSVIRQRRWVSLLNLCGVAVMAAGISLTTMTAHAAFELPEGERITHVGVVHRATPNQEDYERYDPKIGRNFGLAKFWIRGDLRVRPIWRNGVCFGSNIVGNGACNGPNSGTTPNGTPGKQNDFYAQERVRLGIGYDLSPDLNFYFELQDSRTWGGNGANGREGTQDDARNHNGCATQNGGGNCNTLGVRAAYILVRNIAGFQGLSVKAGRQYVVFGNQSLFGAFDWSNTGISHDGVMLRYSTSAWTPMLVGSAPLSPISGKPCPSAHSTRTSAQARSITVMRTKTLTFSFSTTKSSRCRASSSSPITYSTPTGSTRWTTGAKASARRGTRTRPVMSSEAG